MVKRGLDVFLSAALLLFLLPVLLISALIIRLTSPGPVLFRQVRMGRGFRTFEILKFRTMAHAEAGLAYTFGADPRITPFGKWLRRTKLDEIPQLWNVLLGEMSLVGPRPVLPELTYEFLNQYKRLLKVRPGLTDPASLKYSQEAHLLATAPDPWRFFKAVVTPDKLSISLRYMQRANLWTDIETILMTVLICCFPSASKLYGEPPDPWRSCARVSNDLESEIAAMAIESLSVRAATSSSVLSETDVAQPVFLSRTPPGNDGCIFDNARVEIEAAEEDAQSAQLPWIPFPHLNNRGRSTTRAQDRGASTL